MTCFPLQLTKICSCWDILFMEYILHIISYILFYSQYLIILYFPHLYEWVASLYRISWLCLSRTYCPWPHDAWSVTKIMLHSLGLKCPKMYYKGTWLIVSSSNPCYMLLKSLLLILFWLITLIFFKLFSMHFLTHVFWNISFKRDRGSIIH